MAHKSEYGEKLMSAMETKKVKPKLQITARMDGYPLDDTSYRKEEHKRLKKEVSAIEEELKNWDGEAVAARAKKSLQVELASKRARMMECEAMMGLEEA